MKPEVALRKLEPLMPEKVRQWREALDLVEPDLKTLLEKEILLTAHKKLGDFSHRPLLSLPPKRKAAGPIHLGTVVYDGDKWPFAISRVEFLQNMAIFGRSGAGKTNVTFHLLEQLVEEKVPFVFLDWKRTARHLLPSLKGRVRLYTPGRQLSPFPFNPFIAPPGLEYGVYINHVVDVLGDAYTLGDAARSVLQKALRSCRDEGVLAPTTRDLIERIERVPDTERVRGWKASAIRALETLSAIDLAQNEASQKAMVGALTFSNAIIELNGLSPSSKKFLIPMLCLWLYYVKLPTQDREKLGMVIVVEEAHHVLHHQSGSRESLMEMLLRQCREIGIGVVVVDQHPHLMSSAAVGNTYTSICLNLKDPRDVNRAAALSLMEDEDRKHLGRLPVGHGVVKLQDRWREPFLVRFPLVPMKKGAVSDDVLQQHLKADGTLSTLSGLGRASFDERGPDAGSQVGGEPLREDAFRFLNDILTHPDDGVDARYKRLGVSVDKGNRTKKQLLLQGIVSQQAAKAGRTQRLLLRVTPRARRALGLEASVDRGSSIHEYWKRRYASKFKRMGYKVQMEAPRKRGAVDVLARRGTESVAIEIETGKSDVAWNVRQDLLARFSRVIVVATDTQALGKVERDLARAGLILDRITIVLQDNGQTKRSEIDLP